MEESSNHRKSTFVKEIALACLFTLIIIPLLGRGVARQTMGPNLEWEYRRRTTFEDVKRARNGEVFSTIDNWLADNIYLRHRFFKAKVFFLAKYFGTLDDPLYILGQENRVFLWAKGEANDKAAQKTITDYVGLEPFSQSELSRIRSILLDRQNRLDKQGIKYLVVISLDKHTIYPEYLPRSVQQLKGEKTRLDLLVDTLGERPGVNVLDLRPRLLGMKSGDDLYYRTDSHWNNLGSYHVYTAIMERLATMFPDIGLKPFSMEDLLIEKKVGFSFQGMRARYPFDDTFFDIKVRRDPLGGKIPKGLLFHASMGRHEDEGFYRYLKYHFDELATQHQLVKGNVYDEGRVGNENPQIVISEVVERGLEVLLTP
jgi:hypothetical protein